MNKSLILSLKSRIDSIQNAIAVTRSNATPATQSTVEMAIEIAKVEAKLAEAQENLDNMDKFLNNPIFNKSK